MPEYIWDPLKLRYQTATGGLIPQDAILELVENRTADVVSDINDLTDDMIEGRISLGDWQRSVAEQVKDAHISHATLGRGGRLQMGQPEWGRTGGRLKFQYSKLDGFAESIARGELSEAQIRMRARMYGRSTMTAYWDGMHAAAGAADYTEMRRKLRPAEHCEDCEDYAARGWQPIGELPMPKTQSRCLTNCKCVVEYR